MILLVLAGGLAQQASAKGAGQSPSAVFSATFQSDAAMRGGTAMEALTLANTSSHSSKARLGSADITIPSGYDVTDASIAPGPYAGSEGSNGPRAWRVTVSDGAIHLRTVQTSNGRVDTLQPGQLVTVLLRVVTPCEATSSSDWPAVAGSTAGGSDFTAAGPTSLGVGGGCSFSFSVESPQTAGSAIAATVSALGSDGQPTKAYNGTATVSGNLSDSPNGTAPSYDTLTFVDGVASGQPLATPVAAEASRQLEVSDGSMSGTSNPFDVSAGAATLEFASQPSNVNVGTAISPAITVDAADEFGNTEALTAPVTLALGNDASSGVATLGGTLTQTPANDVATFGDITLSAPGSGYTLTASALGFGTATSDPFDVSGIQCPAGTTCGANESGDTVVIAPEGSLTSLSFGPEGESFSCEGDRTAYGSLADFTPADGYTVENPLTITFEYSRALFADLIEGSPAFCLSKDGGESYTMPPPCTVTDGEFTFTNDPPCIESQGFTCGEIETACFGPYVVQLEVTSDDPYAGLG